MYSCVIKLVSQLKQVHTEREFHSFTALPSMPSLTRDWSCVEIFLLKVDSSSLKRMDAEIRGYMRTYFYACAADQNSLRSSGCRHHTFLINDTGSQES